MRMLSCDDASCWQSSTASAVLQRVFKIVVLGWKLFELDRCKNLLVHGVFCTYAYVHNITVNLSQDISSHEMD